MSAARPGATFSREILRGEQLVGEVLFVDGAWVYWRDQNGATRASKQRVDDDEGGST